LDKGYYQSPRWSTEITDCSMPLSFDTYSNCAHQCLYCFSFFQRAVGKSAKDYLHHKVKSVDVEKVKKIFTMDESLVGTAYEQFFPYVKKRYVMQWGGLSDAFDWYEQRFRKSLELLRFFCEINYPISISTKGAWWLDDPEYIDVLRGADNVHIKFTIITTDEQKASVLEAGCATPSERFEAMRKASELLGANRVTLRLRPYIIGVSDLCVDELFQQAADNGAFSVSLEFLCIEKRTTPNHHIRYDAISGQCGYNLFQYYRRHSKTPGYMRLNYDLKRPYVEHMQELVERYNLKLFVSDAHHKEKSCDAGCCGLPSDGVLGNYVRGHFAEAILIAKRNGVVSWDDIADKAAWSKELGFKKAIGFNSGTTRERAKRQYQSMYDFLLDTWNNTKSWASPSRYFGGVLVPLRLDGDGNVIYAYNKPFVEEGRHIESVAELITGHQEPSKTIQYTIFILSKGRAGIATTPSRLDKQGIGYTLVVEPDEIDEYRLEYPEAEILSLPLSGQGISYARQYILDYGRWNNLNYYWQLDDDLGACYELVDGKSIQVDFSIVLGYTETLTSKYDVALAGIEAKSFLRDEHQKPYRFNTRVYSCVLTSTRHQCNYRAEFDTKEDIDFCLQILTTGEHIVCVQKYAINYRHIKSRQPGGLTPLYEDSIDVDISHKFVNEWGEEICKIVNKYGRVDVVIDWKQFKAIPEIKKPERSE